MADTMPPLPPEPPTTPPPAGPEPLPWERPGYPFLEALYETAKLVLTAPREAFARMSLTVDLGRPLLYAVLFGWIGVIASQIYNLAFHGAIMSLMPMMARGGGFLLPTAWSVAIIVLAPIFVLIGAFLWAAIVHLFLMLVGAATSGFAATLRVVCYGSTVQVLNVIPLCGGIIATVWAVVLQIIGLAAAHRTSQGKAALAVLLPLALCCACGILAAIGVGFGIAGLVSSFR